MSTQLSFYAIGFNECSNVLLKTQQAILEAYKRGDQKEVERLQAQLVRSFAARALAVRKVITNSGGKTPGIDGEVWTTASDYMAAIMRLKDLSDYRAKPVRRVYIPKPNGKLRPLGIPTMYDRAVQTLFGFALLPIAEAMADKHSYGFRPYRSVHDCMIYLKLVLGSVTNPRRWILECDINKFFDNISHEWLLKNVPMNKTILRQFLEAGFMDMATFYETTLGTPQGGVISPILGNMALDGLESALGASFLMTRYADDFVVLGSSKESLETVAKTRIAEFLAERELALNLEKTKTVNMEEGFNFLGFHFQEYPDQSRVKGTKQGIFLVKPQPEKVTGLRRKVKEMVKSHYHKPLFALVSKLNPVLRGWAEYYAPVTSKKVFTAVGMYVWQVIWKLLRKKHPSMGLRELKSKYFKNIDGNNWSLCVKDPNGSDIVLYQIGWTMIKRHTICKDLNPFDPANNEYFQKRVAYGARKSTVLNRKGLKLLKLQHGKCPVCTMPLLWEENLEVHHRLSRKSGGSDRLKNLALLHKLCHLQVTHCKEPKLKAVWRSSGLLLG